MEKRSDFEDQWKEAFEDAEITPSANLWKNIDNQLTMQENGKYRKGFIFYRAVAAACTLCLLALGYYVLQNNMNSSNRELANQPAVQKTAPQQETNDNLALEDSNEQTEQDKLNQQQEAAQEIMPKDAQSNSNDTNADNASKSTEEGFSATTLADNEQIKRKRTLTSTSSGQYNAYGVAEGDGLENAQNNIQSEKTISLIALDYVPSKGPKLTEAIINDWTKDIDRLYRVPQVVVDDKASEQKPEFFAGVNLATNYFDPNFSAGSNNTFANALRPSADESSQPNNLDQSFSTLSSRNSPANSGLENKPQLSLSYGVDVGVMLTKHISLESGLDYGRMNASTQTSWVAEDYAQGQRIPLLASNTRAGAEFSNQTQFTPQELQLTNSFAFLAIPLKLGYNLGFERINFNLSSGVAANFFLNNRLSDESGQLNTVNISASSDSPYRPVYYSGVVSSGVNYLIASNYAVSVSPNYNFSLSALTEDGNNFSSQPNAFGVDFGIRYNFR
ncbi:hypothetical protein WJR50_11835 [Catalinimonas sp. 4WD22]|uniref:hypothetical protein n=1 Tax=Catalinimonas locisalis TaxID=3133978 RepID=UPI0031019159